jgi:SAM-dependent methyltransferase
MYQAMTRPYLDFYKEYGPQLVSRELGDRHHFFRQREALLLTLGIPPTAVKGGSVLEFGPGTGHNSLYTDSLAPARYLLVDGSPEILSASEARLSSSPFAPVEREFVVSLFDEFQTEERFDLVIAEACIPNQVDPAGLLLKMCEFVRPGGLMLFTTVSGASWLSEIVRRLIKIEISDDFLSSEELLSILEKKLVHHFSSLGAMARSPREWMLDNLFQPLFEGKLFSLSSALEALPPEFVVTGTSPRFLQDWRWYKEIESSGGRNQLIDCYLSNVINFVDRGTVNLPHRIDTGREIESLSEKVWIDIRRVELGEKDAEQMVYFGLSKLAKIFSALSPTTGLALNEALKWIKEGLPDRTLEYFPSWWGRGQQHIGVYRRSVG